MSTITRLLVYLKVLPCNYLRHTIVQFSKRFIVFWYLQIHLHDQDDVPAIRDLGTAIPLSIHTLVSVQFSQVRIITEFFLNKQNVQVLSSFLTLDITYFIFISCNIWWLFAGRKLRTTLWNMCFKSSALFWRQHIHI